MGIAPGSPRPKGFAWGVWGKPLLLLAFLTAVLAFLWVTGLISFFLDIDRMTAFIASLGHWGFAGFVLLQAAQVAVAPIPGEATGILGGFFFGPYLGVLLSTAGLTLGSTVAFILSKKYGRPLVDRFVDPNVIARFDFLLHHKGALLVFILFLLPGFPKDYFCYILGLGHLTLKEFLLISATGRFFGTVLLTVGGSLLRSKSYVGFSILVGVAILVVIVVYVFKDKIMRHHKGG